ncbi:hypothetical protein PRIPAC_97142 [Pristionchus pacificus]|uniref:Uncharacterized protein n=1 Tax=Pristionchus pacificus TaxID=54126 RepID=A0A2A6B345_PRIPA|nr:hypothetical protein PRIPAC_97142 [Pristionchus pacificus]|eukprot:PDM60290.1 hypothetical protein PRIPAC_54115 [Pristionchus pacificus]
MSLNPHHIRSRPRHSDSDSSVVNCSSRRSMDDLRLEYGKDRGKTNWNLSGEYRIFAEYFPLKLVKTAELDPERNYIIGSHPHEVLSIGACATFLTESTSANNSGLLTLNGQFWFPLRREFGFVIGGAESSRTSLKWNLRNPGKVRPAENDEQGVMRMQEVVDRVENSTDLEVDLLHEKYCNALVDLFEKNKDLTISPMIKTSISIDPFSF